MNMSEIPWEKIEGEPPIWYELFTQFYLPLGPIRTLLRAYKTWLGMAEPEKLMRGTMIANPPNEWREQARIWLWKERAEAFDELTYQEAHAHVEEARLTLMNAADTAAKALVKATEVPRTAVQASNAILDRVGLPATVAHQVALVTFTADDLHKASEGLNSWRHKKRSESSGSNAPKILDISSTSIVKSTTQP